MKNFRLESWPKIFLWSPIYVRTMSFHFQRNFQLKIFHRDRDRHNDRRSTYFCKICNSPPDNGDCDGDGDGEKFLTGHFAENEMAKS